MIKQYYLTNSHLYEETDIIKNIYFVKVNVMDVQLHFYLLCS